MAILIFALGGGIAIYEGIHHIIEPVEIANVKVNYIVLGLAILFEGTSLLVALKQFKKDNTKFGLIKSMRRSKDSSSFTIIIEDFGALIGLVVAIVGLAVGDVYGWPYADGLASVIIGLILTGMAIFLAIETKALLIGESMDEESILLVEQILQSNTKITEFGLLRSVHFGPTGVMVGVDVHFEDQCSLEEVESEIVKIEGEIKEAVPVVKHVFIEIKEIV